MNAPQKSELATLSYRPLYLQIKSQLLSRLGAGEWKAGAVLPSETELARYFGVSQGTVRKAIDEMAAENLLVRRQGKGTFVASHDDPRSFFRFLCLVADDEKAIHLRSRPLSCTHTVASEEVALALAVAENAPVVHVQRLLNVDNTPLIYDDIWLNGDLFVDLSLEQMLSWDHSLYSLFESQFGVCMVRAEENLRAVAACLEVAGQLDVTPGSPLLSVERTTFTYGNKAVEWRKGLYLTTRHHYANTLS